MSLEQDIQQSSFKTDRQKLMVNIIYTYHWINERLQKIFACRDITPQQFNILRILRGAGEPLSTNKIRERMLDRMSDTSRIVDRLLAKGFVEKRICLQDKRLVDVQITEKGKALLTEMDGIMDGMENSFLHLEDAEMLQLNNLLDKVRYDAEK